MRGWKLFAVLALVAAAIIAVIVGMRPASPPKAPVVLAASSLQEALEDAGRAWQAKGHSAPVLSFAASSALARQIESARRRTCSSPPTSRGWTSFRKRT